MNSNSESLKERNAQIETAVKEMVDMIEGYYGAAPFEFIEGEEAPPGFGNGLDESKMDRWLAVIEPRTVKIQADMDDHKADAEAKGYRPCECEIRLFTKRMGFYVGVLVGCKFMGEELIRKGQGLLCGSHRQ